MLFCWSTMLSLSTIVYVVTIFALAVLIVLGVFDFDFFVYLLMSI